MFRLTKKGLEKVRKYMAEAEKKQKEVLSANPDTSIRDTFIPDEDDVYNDLQQYEGADEPGEYRWLWSVSDDGDMMDYPLVLMAMEDYIPD